MLQSIRNKTQGPITWLIVGAIALSFSFFFLGTNLFSVLFTGAPTTAAKVNGHTIPWQVIDQRLDYELRNIFPDKTSLSLSERNQIKLRMLQDMVKEYSILDFINNSGLVVSEQQKFQEIRNISEFQINGKFSPEKYKTIMSQTGNNADALYRSLSQNMLKQQLYNGIRLTGGFIAESLQQLDYAVLHQERNFHYVVIPGEKFTNKVKLTDAEIETYFNENKAEYNTQELVKLEYLELKLEDIAKTVSPTTDELKKYYNDNLAQYSELGNLDKVQKTLRQDFITEEAEKIFSEKLTQFESLVFENSDNLQAAAVELELKIKTTDFVSRQSTDIVEPLALNAAFTEDVLQNRNNSDTLLVKPGHYIVIRVKDYKPSVEQDLDTVRNNVVYSLSKERASKLAREFAEQLQTDLLASIGSTNNKILDGYKELNLNWIERISVDRDDRNVDQDILSGVFNMNNSQPVEVVSVVGVEDGYDDYAVVKLDSIKAGDLDEINEQSKTKFLAKMSGIYKQQELELIHAQAQLVADVKYY